MTVFISYDTLTNVRPYTTSLDFPPSRGSWRRSAPTASWQQHVVRPRSPLVRRRRSLTSQLRGRSLSASPTTAEVGA